MENLCKKILKYHSEDDGYNLILLIKKMCLDNISYQLCFYFSTIFPHSTRILFELGLVSYYTNRKDIALETCYKLIDTPNINESMRKRCFDNISYCVDMISNRYIHYNKEIVDKILNRKKNMIPLITFTITTCKRLDLLTQTMNSFINCCTDIDLIDEWLCVDDNSSEEDRYQMNQLYPFFTFYLKDSREKGHPRSMNIIRKSIKTPYVFHMEDDWKFFTRTNYITKCLEVLCEQSSIGQCLINKNYSETAQDYRILGGEMKTTVSGLRYYIHEYCDTTQREQEWLKKHGYGNHCNYWPHYSLRPSLLKRQVLDDIGEFNENASHFELEYSHRYIKKGYISVFLEHVYSLHIGRLTSQRDDPNILNAYKLNNENQFTHSSTTVNSASNCVKSKTFLIKSNNTNNNHIDTNHEIINEIDANVLVQTPQLKRLFEGNNHNMNCKIIGNALTHISLYIKLYYSDNDYFIIFDRDVIILPNFNLNLENILKEVQDWDIIYIGSEKESRRYSYLISKKGSKKILDYIEKKGVTDHIDIVCRESKDELSIYSISPNLVSEIEHSEQQHTRTVNKLIFENDTLTTYRLFDGTTYNLNNVY